MLAKLANPVMACSGIPSAAPRMRILMLHSFRTSGAILKEQVRRSGLQKPLNEVADLVSNLR